MCLQAQSANLEKTNLVANQVYMSLETLDGENVSQKEESDFGLTSELQGILKI